MTSASDSPADSSAPRVDDESIRERVREHFPQIRSDLEDLVRIPSVSAAAFDQVGVERSALAVAQLLRSLGLPEVEVLRIGHLGDSDAGAPAVVARRPALNGFPTVLLYAHHDVQPPGDETAWTSPPFVPQERDGRLYGRGTADDKAGLMVHVAALRALGPARGLGITVFVEGEEEIGSPTFDRFLATHHDRLAADVIVVADSGNWRIGVPALTTTLRGLVDGFIEVRTLDHAVHSGMYGGAVPDAMTALITLLGTLWTPQGEVAVAGLLATEDPNTVEYLEADLRADSGILDGVELIGTGPLAARMWSHPSLTVIGLDAPSVALASNTLQASIRAKFSLRIAPGQDPAAAFTALRDHLAARAPWGAQVEVTLNESGHPFSANVDGPVYDTARWALERAWGHPPVHMGVGGSIPFVAALQEVYPEATVLFTGVEDPDTRAHGIDESLHLAEFEKACVAEALFLAALAAARDQP